MISHTVVNMEMFSYFSPLKVLYATFYAKKFILVYMRPCGPSGCLWLAG